MMRLLSLTAALLLLSSCAFGCTQFGGASQDQPSAFMQNLSLEALIRNHEQDLTATIDISSSSVYDQQADFFQKQQHAQVRIEPTRIPTLMTNLRLEIEHALASSEAQFLGSGSEGLEAAGTFSIRYQQETAQGVVNVYGVRGEGDSLTIILLITEGF